VPLSFRERATIVLVALAAVSALVVGLWVWSSSSRDEDIAKDLLSRLARGDDESAYAMLDPELQAEIGSPAELGRRWKASGVAGIAALTVCSGVSLGSSTVKMRATVTPASAAPAGPFVLGPSVSDRSCKGQGPMPLVVVVSEGKVAAVSLEPG
jgi:hypothetical protein